MLPTSLLPADEPERLLALAPYRVLGKAGQQASPPGGSKRLPSTT